MKTAVSKRFFIVFLALAMVMGMGLLAAPLVSAQNIIGLMYASGVRAGEDIVLWGDTTLVMDQDLTVPSIQGDYNLTIEGSGTLTVNGSGNGIDVKNLNCTSDLFIQTGWHAIEAAETVYISNTESFIVGGIYATGNIDIYCHNATIAGNGNAIVSTLGNITLSGDAFDIGANGVAVQADVGDINMSGTFTVNSNDGRTIDALKGAVTVEGSLKSTSGAKFDPDVHFAERDKFSIGAAGGFNFYGTTLEVTGLGGIRAGGSDISITADSVSIIVERYQALFGKYISVDSDELWLENEGSEENENVVYDFDTVCATEDVTLSSESGGIVGEVCIRTEGALTLNGNFVVGGDPDYENATINVLRMEATGNLTVRSGKTVAIKTSEGFSFYGQSLDVKGSMGILVEEGDVNITAETTEIASSGSWAILGRDSDSSDGTYSCNVYIDSDYLMLDGVENPVGWGCIETSGSVTIYSEEARVIGHYGIRADGDIFLDGNFVVCGNPDFAIKTSEDFTFYGTTLDIEGFGGIDAYGEVNITADNVSVLTQKSTCIEGNTVFIDCDVLRLENVPNVNDPTVGQYGISCFESATVNCPDATIISCDNGIYANGFDVTLNGNFTILGKGDFGSGIWASNLYLNGGQFTVASNARQAINAGRVEVNGNLAVSTKGEDYCLFAQEFIFNGTTLAANGHAGIRGKYTDITADSVVITTDVGTPLCGYEVYLTANYLWAENKATKDSSTWTQYGINAVNKLSLTVKNGTVIGYNQALYVHDPNFEYDNYYIYVNGALTVVSRNKVGVYVPQGIAEFNGGPIVVVGEDSGIYANEVCFSGGSLRVDGNNGIHAINGIELSGDDIKITAFGERSSGIWTENGSVDLMGEVVIETNGWYGINAASDVSFGKGYYQISGPKNNAQAVKVGGTLYMDGTLEIVDPKYGHVNGNEIYGNGDSPAMELEMYSAIPEVSLYIDLPREGKLPTRNASGIYFLDPRCTVEEIVWYEDGVELVSQDAVFRAGHSYTVRIFISADDPYRFLGDVMGKVNDKEVSTGLTDRKIMRLTADLGECPVAIRSVDLEIRSPEEGKAPSTAVTAASTAYGVYSRNVRWAVSTDGVNFVSMEDGEKFVGGKYYRVFMDVTLAGNDYKFPTTTADGTLQPDVVSTVNGSPAVTEKAYDQDPQTVITVYFDFGKCNDYIIEEITIVDVVAPVAGQRPTYTANMFGTGYHIDTTKNSYEDISWKNPPEKWYYVKNGISWWDVTDGGYDYVYENDVFLPGHEYRCQVYVVTEDGYEFVNNPYTEVWPTATINGNSATIKQEGSGLMWEQQISYTFTCEETVVNRIVVDGINFPKEGQAPDYSPILGNTDLYALDTDYGLNGSGIYWYDCEGRQLEAGEVFGDAGPYRMAIKFVPVYENGVPLCGFAYDVDVMINGKYVTPYGDWDDIMVGEGAVWAFYTFKNNSSAAEAEQTYTLSGSINVSSATVTLLRGDDVVSTLTAGTTYSIENLAVGVYTLRVSKDGYETAEYSIVITTNTVQDITLTAASILGDVNGDGEVDIKDANLICSYYNEVVDLSQEALAVSDVNGDGEIDIKDANLICSYYNEIIEEFPINN